jgi:hypothetical protein
LDELIDLAAMKTPRRSDLDTTPREGACVDEVSIHLKKKEFKKLKELLRNPTLQCDPQCDPAMQLRCDPAVRFFDDPSVRSCSAIFSAIPERLSSQTDGSFLRQGRCLRQLCTKIKGGELIQTIHGADIATNQTSDQVHPIPCKIIIPPIITIPGGVSHYDRLTNRYSRICVQQMLHTIEHGRVLTQATFHVAAHKTNLGSDLSTWSMKTSRERSHHAWGALEQLTM